MQTLLIIALLAGPAWVQEEPEIVLNGSQKASLGSTVAAIWPGVSVPGVWQLDVVRDGSPRETRCRPIELRTGTIEDFDSAELWVGTPDVDTSDPPDGKLDQSPGDRGAWVRFLDEAGGVVSWEWTPGYKVVTGDEQTLLASWVSLVWPSTPIGKVRRMRAQRGSGSEVSAKMRWRNDGTRAQYLAALKAGKVKARTGNQ